MSAHRRYKRASFLEEISDTDAAPNEKTDSRPYAGDGMESAEKRSAYIASKDSTVRDARAVSRV